MQFYLELEALVWIYHWVSKDGILMHNIKWCRKNIELDGINYIRTAYIKYEIGLV